MNLLPTWQSQNSNSTSQQLIQLLEHCFIFKTISIKSPETLAALKENGVKLYLHIFL